MNDVPSKDHASCSYSRSCPLVEVLISSHALKSVEILGADHHGVGVSSSESFSNPCVVQALSISELHVTDPATDGSTEEHSGESQHNASVEISGIQSDLLGVVPVSEASTEGG